MKPRTFAAAAALVAMLASVPATARDPGQRDRKPRHERHERHRDKSDDAVGALAVGAVLVGIAAALSSKKKKAAVQEAIYVPPAPSGTDPDAAMAACAAAAEDEGRRSYPLAQAGTVSAVDPAGEGFAVQGDVVLRNNYRDTGERRVFRCSVDAQAVRRIAIDWPAEPSAEPSLAAR